MAYTFVFIRLAILPNSIQAKSGGDMTSGGFAARAQAATAHNAASGQGSSAKGGSAGQDQGQEHGHSTTSNDVTRHGSSNK